MSHTPSVEEIRLCAVHGRDHVTNEEFQRGLEAVRREAKAEALRKAERSFRPIPEAGRTTTSLVERTSGTTCAPSSP